MSPYFPVVLAVGFGIFLGCTLSALAHFMGPRKYRKEKHDPYECGVPKVTGAQEKMSVKFYLTAILFILFDIESIFLFLWAKTFDTLGWFGMVEIIIFMLVLGVGYVFVLRKGALEWD